MDRVNVINPFNGKTVLRNATVIGTLNRTVELPPTPGAVRELLGTTPMVVVTHRTERFPVAVPAAHCVAYVPRTRNATA